MAYEITCNPDIQQKLFEEISDTEYELNGAKLTYEKIQSLKYLDQVISETLRHWPVLGVREFFPLKCRALLCAEVACCNLYICFHLS